MNKNMVWILVAVLALAVVGGIIVLGGKKTTPTETPTNNTQQMEDDGSDQSEEEETPSQIFEGTASVSIKDMVFNPANITVKKGTKVTWTNNDITGHTVTSSDGSFDSGDMSSGETFSFTFDTVGEFSYRCSIHPEMIGKVTVVE